MIIVTGTKRSGTSMWMQILAAAGFPVIGEAFPSHWERSLQEANRAGFYESRLRNGVYYATNPDPESGQFVTPGQSRQHAVKVFIPGLVRSDFGYIERVLATMRHWREYARSLRRLYAIEDQFHREREAAGEVDSRDRETQARWSRAKLEPELEWWFENYDLIRDIAVRGYSVHMLTYDRLLADPEREVSQVLDWLGAGDKQAAVAAVQPKLRTQVGGAAEDEDATSTTISPAMARTFDDLYDAVHSGRGLTQALIEQLNTVHATLEPILVEHIQRQRRQVREQELDALFGEQAPT